METADRIYEEVRTLPESLKQQVLQYVEALARELRAEDVAWSELSLQAAIRGLEDDNPPEYGESDFTEKWR